MTDPRIQKALVVASISGGKDSAALSLHLKEQGIPHGRVFADTGWEHESLYQYLRGPLQKAIGPITEVGYPGGMPALVKKKKMFPSRLRRFCTEELKVKPILAELDRARELFGDVVSAVGIRAEESSSRAEMPEWEYSGAFDCWVWRPLISWTEQDVIDIHRRHGLAPNPLYLKGARRVGCWPCIFARKSEIRMVADLSPERIDAIRSLEAELPRNTDGTQRTFFHGKLTREGHPVPIDRAVAWSRTKHGGKELDLTPGQPDGCVRWGLCEAEPEGDRD